MSSDFDGCESNVNVKIQRRKGGWKTVANATTSDSGRYRADSETELAGIALSSLLSS